MAGQLQTGHEDHTLKPASDGVYYWHLELHNINTDLELYKIVYAFDRAINGVGGKYYHPLRFVSTPDPDKAQLKMKFRDPGAPDLPFPFQEETIAYAFYPGYGYDGVSYFNNKWDWADSNSFGRVNLEPIIAHEVLGHNFNISHNEHDDKCVMFPYDQRLDEIEFRGPSLEAMDLLYGKLKAQYGGNSGISHIDLFKELFTSKSSINKLTSKQCAYVLRKLGIEAPRYKKNKVAAIYDALK